MIISVANAQIELIFGDITTVKADSIVNAANSLMLGGSGVDGAIHKAAGPTLRIECVKLLARHGPLKQGHAVVTGAGKLAARFVVHTVGPIWLGGKLGEAKTLAACYTNCLAECANRHVTSVAFPAISTGAYFFPPSKAASIAIDTVTEYLTNNHSSSLNRVVFALFTQSDYDLYASLLTSRLANA